MKYSKFYVLVIDFLEGVQLLCLIDKGLDACRYLQTYGEWEQAASLAKVSWYFSSVPHFFPLFFSLSSLLNSSFVTFALSLHDSISLSFLPSLAFLPFSLPSSRMTDSEEMFRGSSANRRFVSFRCYLFVYIYLII